MRRPRLRRSPRRSAVLVPLPEAAIALEAAGANGHGADGGLPPHVTVLYPFLAPRRCADEAVHAALGEIAAATAAFDVALGSLGRFPGVLYLAPDPGEPFVALTHAVHARWPDHPPYEGAYADVIPHLTAVAGDEPAGVADALGATLPVRARARELALLVEQRGGTWATVASWPLGGGR